MVKSTRSRMRTKRRNKVKSKKLQYKRNIRRSKKGKKKRTKRYMNKRGGSLFAPPGSEDDFSGAVVQRGKDQFGRAVEPKIDPQNLGRRRDIGGDRNFQGEAYSGYDESRENYRTQAEGTSAGKHGERYKAGHAQRVIDEGDQRDRISGWTGGLPNKSEIDRIYNDVKSDARWCRDNFDTSPRCTSPLNTAGFCEWKPKSWLSKARCMKNKEAIESYEDNKEYYYKLLKNPNP